MPGVSPLWSMECNVALILISRLINTALFTHHKVNHFTKSARTEMYNIMLHNHDQYVHTLTHTHTHKVIIHALCVF